MEGKIDELTKKLYYEGIEKGEEEAKKMISEANSRAEQIVSDAKKEAEKILSDAKEQADDLKRNVSSEIKLSGQQSINAIKQQIIDVLAAKVVDGSVTDALSEPKVMEEFITTIISNWKSSDSNELSILLPEANRDKLEDALTKGLRSAMDAGVTVSFTKNVKGGFQIGPKDGSYKISLTDEDFIEYFKEYLRPKTRKFLFD